ncbi:MAG TPA: hypothetical protein VIN08_17035 [Ohtaekwangia sp.]|uniref:hypothetical protein n=1 Tax=Ohtaekwangia sp. TaxID=2066019 RepID=UPI002F92C61D
MSQSSAIESLYQEELYQLPSRVLIILSKPWETHSEDERTVLSKMLAAVRLNMGSVQIIIRNDFTIEDLLPLAPSKVLALGAQLKSSAKMYEHLTLNGVSVIAADSISNLDDLKKKNLWIALKQMFGL